MYTQYESTLYQALTLLRQPIMSFIYKNCLLTILSKSSALIVTKARTFNLKLGQS